MKPAGTLTPGHPRTFHGQEYGHAAIIALSVRRVERPAISPVRSGGTAVLGVSTTSKRSKISPIRCRDRGSAARAARSAPPPRSSPRRAFALVRVSRTARSGTWRAHSRMPAIERGTKPSPIRP
ncbi:hypothetical protein AF335_27960 [Streptomyces eurocidicus]|uniref:Uncharacterized protein n=1 Tax=Streptomyces eurocidicus TaxID=66423 RepID=A0A2N8NPE8_STREU|nr:hypothetical protein AF335_27960 [Streptomyces eurocidicus]